MKFTLSWLKEHLETDANAQQIAEALTAIGLEVESVEDRSALLRPFIVAEILEANPHPQADRLRVCRVRDGKTERQVVCGAPNARAGIKVILATEGVVIPNGEMKIKKSTIRGVESNGMLCSAGELGLSGESEGIVELPTDAPLGESVVGVLGLDDPLFDIAITPNRGDALGVRGIAQDLTAADLGTLKPLKQKPITSTTPSAIAVQIDNSLACPLFVSATIRGVTNGESPEWLKRRLTSIGLKPISALVDITNFITFDLGRPLHVYDLAKLSGDLRVRSARDGEKFHALNDREYLLEDGMVVIADRQGVQSLGGIIGGMWGSVQEDTHDILLEAALFDPIQIAETGRKLQIDSDARYRFERQVDPLFVKAGCEIAANLIREICGGEISKLSISGEEPFKERPALPLRLERVRSFGGANIPDETALNILKLLGFKSELGSNRIYNVTPPSWRSDIGGEADLIEEILRIHGFDKIVSTPLPETKGVTLAALTPVQRRLQKARRMLAARGMLETITYAFIPDAHAQLFGTRRESMQLINPISTDLSTMRPSLLPNLIAAASRNHARGMWNLALFEIGRQFDGLTPDAQRRVIAGLRTGQSEERSHYKTERPVDAMDAKADLYALLQMAGLDAAKLQLTDKAPEWYHPGRSGSLSLGGKIILGYFGELHPKILRTLGVDQPSVGFELFVENLPESKNKTIAKAPFKPSDYQAIERDFAFIVEGSLAVGLLTKAIEKALGNARFAVRLFDLYTGPNLGEGKKSLAFSIRIEPEDHTLTEPEIDSLSRRVIEAAESLGGVLRQ